MEQASICAWLVSHKQANGDWWLLLSAAACVLLYMCHLLACSHAGNQLERQRGSSCQTSRGKLADDNVIAITGAAGLAATQTRCVLWTRSK
jgi:hypothetical protein